MDCIANNSWGGRGGRALLQTQGKISSEKIANLILVLVWEVLCSILYLGKGHNWYIGAYKRVWAVRKRELGKGEAMQDSTLKELNFGRVE